MRTQRGAGSEPRSDLDLASLVVPITLIFAFVLLGSAARGSGPLPGDLATTRLLQGIPIDGLVGIVLLYAGSAAWFLPAVAAAVAPLWRRWAGALCVLLAAVVAVLVGDALKGLVGRPRPSVGLVTRYDVPQGYSFPSGTALLTVVVLGVVCCLLLRYGASRRVTLAAVRASVVVSVTVGLSRIYVGEHWASDVLGGWVSGVAFLLVALLVLRFRRPGTSSGLEATGPAGPPGAP